MSVFRGWFQLDGREIANTNRVIAHVGRETPTSDLGVFTRNSRILIEDPPGSGNFLPTLPPAGPDTYYPTGLLEDDDWDGEFYDPNEGPGACALVPSADHPGFFEIPASSRKVGNFWTVPNGARQWTPGMFAFDGRCWEDLPACRSCNVEINKRDGWDGLREFLGGGAYRLPLAPWYTTRVPESGEFTGVWVMSVEGLDSTPISRTITELAGDGASAGAPRAGSRKLTFEALLFGCTDAGLAYGLEWLNCQLRLAEDSDGSRLRFFAANPTGSVGDPSDLIREARGVVLTQEAQIVAGASMRNIHRVRWEMVATRPHLYYPEISMDIAWSEIVIEPINWVHAPDCVKPETCDRMPILFSTECVPEVIEIVSSPPPVCGGCLPVCATERYVWQAPTRDFPLRCRQTAVNLTIRNTGPGRLTVQTYWRVCGTDIRCQDNQFPLDVVGLPANSSITIDSVTSDYWAERDGKPHRPIGIVKTPDGAPWQPTIIDRATCWEFVVLAPPDAEFTASVSFADRTS